MTNTERHAYTNDNQLVINFSVTNGKAPNVAAVDYTFDGGKNWERKITTGLQSTALVVNEGTYEPNAIQVKTFTLAGVPSDVKVINPDYWITVDLSIEEDYQENWGE